MVRLGTKWPSITSRWSILAPPRSTCAMSSARRAKSADRIEGTISIIYELSRFYHTGVETVPGIAPRYPAHTPRNQRLRNRRGHPFGRLGVARAGTLHHTSAVG